MEPMNDSLELRGDDRDEYLAHLEAENGCEPEIVNDDELKSLLAELWQEEYDRELARLEQDEYTEEDAFRDFYSDYCDSME